MIGKTFSSWHVSVAAEATAAALFARFGLDVSVQYGANQPEYDLIIARGERLLKVSVKGSQSGSWGLTQSYLERRDYLGAIDKWLRRHKRRTILCFVQFEGVGLSELPRVYLATPREVAARLRSTAKGRGSTILFESRVWGPRAHGAGTIDRIPNAWRLSAERLERLFRSA